MKAGFDLSSHQGTVNWRKIESGFAMIRAGWSWYLGGMNIDQRFVENAAGAQAAGIPWGSYLYAYDQTPEAAVISAGRLADLLDNYRLPYPVAYDFEDGQYLAMGRERNTAICRAFLSTLQKRGYYVMLYTYTNFAKGYLQMEELAEYDLWVADYTGKVGWPGEYGIWQYTAAGSLAGITGPVDLDRAYKDYPSIIQRAGLNGYGKRPGPEEELLALRAENAVLRGKLEAVREIVGDGTGAGTSAAGKEADNVSRNLDFPPLSK